MFKLRLYKFCEPPYCCQERLSVGLLHPPPPKPTQISALVRLWVLGVSNLRRLAGHDEPALVRPNFRHGAAQSRGRVMPGRQPGGTAACTCLALHDDRAELAPTQKALAAMRACATPVVVWHPLHTRDHDPDNVAPTPRKVKSTHCLRHGGACLQQAVGRPFTTTGNAGKPPMWGSATTCRWCRSPGLGGASA